MPTLDRIRFKSAEYVFTVHNAVIPLEHTLEQVLEPEYWSGIAGSGLLRPSDQIRCEWEDQNRITDLYVRRVGKTWADVLVRLDSDFREKSAPQLPKEAASKYKLQWRGPHHRWSIIHIESGEVIKGVDGEFHSQTDAANWLREYVKAVA